MEALMGMFLFILALLLILSVALICAFRCGSSQRSHGSEADSGWFCDWAGSDSFDRSSHQDSSHHGGGDNSGSHHGGFDGGGHHGGFDGGGFDGGGGHH